jgi:hypothetical protein
MESIYDIYDELDAWRIDLRRAEREHATFMRKAAWSPDDCAQIDWLREMIAMATEAITALEAELAAPASAAAATPVE